MLTIMASEGSLAPLEWLRDGAVGDSHHPGPSGPL